MANDYLKLRSDLIVHAETDADATVYVIKDPITQRFYRLRAPEYYLLSRADGNTTPESAAQLTQERFGIRIPEASVRTFYHKMERLLFFEGPALERMRNAVINVRRRSIWMIPLKAFDPDALLSRWVPKLRLLFTPVAVALGLLLMACALVIAASQSSLWQANLIAIWELSSIPLLLAAVLVLALVHEFGHALTLKYYGGTVREMGLLLLYFQPCFYSNISDTYLLSGRRPRLMVGLAGVFFQGILTALAIVLWRLVEPNNVISDFLWVMTAMSLVLFLFNFNPLIKLDGYYLLVDALRVPNLRAKAFAYWRGLLGEWLWARRRVFKSDDRHHLNLYRSYGMAAAIYTGLFVGWFLYLVSVFLHARWGSTGVAGFWGLIVLFAVTTRSRQSAHQTMTTTDAKETTEDVPTERRWIKPLTVWGGFVVVFIVLALVPLERRVGSSCEVEPRSRFTVMDRGGTIETGLIVGSYPERRERSVIQAGAADFSVIAYDLRPREGETVRRGDTLLAISSNRYKAELLQKIAERDRIIAERGVLVSGPKKDEILQVSAEVSEYEAQVDHKRAELERGDLMYKGNLISKEQYDERFAAHEMAVQQLNAKKSELDLLVSGPKAEELEVKEAQIAGLDAEIEFLRSQIAASIVSSPIDGVVTRVQRGGTMIEVASLDPVRLRLSVNQDDITDVGVDSPVDLKVRALPFETFHGRVAHIASDADTIGQRREFIVTTDVDNPNMLLRPGMTGFAKIACGRRSALSLISRRLVHFLRVEFWSWW